MTAISTKIYMLMPLGKNMSASIAIIRICINLAMVERIASSDREKFNCKNIGYENSIRHHSSKRIKDTWFDKVIWPNSISPYSNDCIACGLCSPLACSLRLPGKRTTNARLAFGINDISPEFVMSWMVNVLHVKCSTRIFVSFERKMRPLE